MSVDSNDAQFSVRFCSRLVWVWTYTKTTGLEQLLLGVSVQSELSMQLSTHSIVQDPKKTGSKSGKPWSYLRTARIISSQTDRTYEGYPEPLLPLQVLAESSLRMPHDGICKSLENQLCRGLINNRDQ